MAVALKGTHYFPMGGWGEGGRDKIMIADIS